MHLRKLRVVYWGFASFRGDIGDDDNVPPKYTRDTNGDGTVGLKRDAAADLGREYVLDRLTCIFLGKPHCHQYLLLRSHK